MLAARHLIKSMVVTFQSSADETVSCGVGDFADTVCKISDAGKMPTCHEGIIREDIPDSVWNIRDYADGVCAIDLRNFNHPAPNNPS